MPIFTALGAAIAAAVGGGAFFAGVCTTSLAEFDPADKALK